VQHQWLSGCVGAVVSCYGESNTLENRVPAVTCVHGLHFLNALAPTPGTHQCAPADPALGRMHSACMQPSLPPPSHPRPPPISTLDPPTHTRSPPYLC
jgi:hypothetical protein